MFFDVDGTLLDYETGVLSQSAMLALNVLQQQGVLVGLATGRQLVTCHKLFDEYITFDFYITSNGRVVEIDGQVVHEEGIDKQALETLIALDKQYDTGLFFGSKSAAATHCGLNEKGEVYLNDLHIPLPPVDATFYLREVVTQAMIYCNEQVEAEFKRALPQLEFIRHAKDGIDIVKVGPMKEQGIKLVLAYFKMGQADALAFGDGVNDLSMFRYIDGIALADGAPSLKKLAKQTIGKVSEDAIYYYLKEESYIL